MIRWWCSAEGLAWTWEWQPYVGVWLVIGLLAAGYIRLHRLEGSGRMLRFGAGLVLLWTALDWPLGLLGAGYLASAHVLQFLAIALVVPALLLSGLPAPLFERIRARPRTRAALRALTHPVLTILAFASVMVVSHVPAVADAAKASPIGNFIMETAWLGAGTLLWWPVLCPVPRRRFHPLARMGYLLLTSIPGTALCMFLVFAEYPQYAVYELAPRVPGLELGVAADQRLAGLLMKFGAGLVLWTVVTVMFFRWYRSEEREESAAAGPPRGGGSATATG